MTRASALSRVVLGVTALCVLASSATAAPKVDPRTAAAKAARDEQFRDNLATYEAKGPDEQRVIAVLTALKRAHESFDGAALAGLLASDFEWRSYPTKDRVAVQTRAEYLKLRDGWKVRTQSTRELTVAVQAAHLSGKTGRLAVTALTTYRSKYFAPRFLEAFVFTRQDGGWKLWSIMSYPMRPPSPDMYEAQVMFAGATSSEQTSPEAIARDVMTEGPDVLVDGWRPTGTNRASTAPIGPFLVVFREPPPDRAVIQMEELTPGSVTPYLPTKIEIRSDGSPFFYLVSASLWRFTGKNYFVNVSVRLNGAAVAKEELEIVR